MIITILPADNNKTAELFLDTNGNVYIFYNENLYDVSITGTNTLVVSLIPNITQQHIDDMNVTSTFSLNKGMLKLNNKERSLKGRIVREKLKEKSENPDQDKQEEDDEEDDKNDKNKEIKYNEYYYENNTYQEDFTAVDSDDEEEKVFFLGKGVNDIKILNYDDDVPLYDTLIYDNDINTGEPVIKTKLVNTEPIFRLKIYKSGNILFRPIGCPEQSYELVLNENILTLRHST